MLQGKHLILREWRESDLDALATLRNDVDLQALLMAQAKPNSTENVRVWLHGRSNRDDVAFFVAAALDQSVLGYLQVLNIDRSQGVGDLGICFSPAAQGRGLAREACALLELYLRTTLHLRKLTLKVLTSNLRAIAFYRKEGYREVGILERQFRMHDRFEDVMIMEKFIAA